MFEGVEVELGPRQDDYYPVTKGLKPGDKVAAAGGFLIDAETRLNPAAATTYFGASGGPQADAHPGLPPAPNRRQGDQAPAGQGEPDSHRARPEPRVAAAAPEPDDLKNIEQLPEADRPLALKQRICPVTGAPLGSMGVPVKILLRGQTVFLCCKACVGKAKRSPEEMLKKLEGVLARKGP